MASFGETLKRERELREISLREISDATKINIRYLEALETNRFDILPGGLFNKGFIRAYATFIGVDSETMVTSYLHEISARKGGGAGSGGDAPPAVHRPSETPRRRAALAPADTAAPARAGPRHETMPVQAEAPQFAITGIERAPRTAATPGAGGAAGADHPPAAGSASRVLWGIVTLVAAAAAILLILSFVIPRRRPDGESLAAAGRPPARPADRHEAPAGSGAAPITVEVIDESGPQSAGGSPAGSAAGSPGRVRSPGQAAVPPPVARSTPRPTPAPRPAAAAAPLEPVPPPGQVPINEESALPETSGRGPGPMSLRVEARGRTWVQLTCDSREAINWVMRAGDSETMECLRIIRISAADAAAVTLRVNEASCMPLGEAGERVYGYTIRIDDFAKICPGSRRGRNG